MFHGITRLKNHYSFFFRSVECLSENLNNCKKNLELLKTAVGRPIPNKNKIFLQQNLRICSQKFIKCTSWEIKIVNGRFRSTNVRCLQTVRIYVYGLPVRVLWKPRYLEGSPLAFSINIPPPLVKGPGEVNSLYYTRFMSP